MIKSNLKREFKPNESSLPYIIPALINGLTVTVTLKVAQEFRLANPSIIRKGQARKIKFEKVDLGLIEMSLEKK